MALQSDNKMTNTYKLLVLPGDGIGPEVMNEALKISQCISEFLQ